MVLLYLLNQTKEVFCLHAITSLNLIFFSAKALVLQFSPFLHHESCAHWMIIPITVYLKHTEKVPSLLSEHPPATSPFCSLSYSNFSKHLSKQADSVSSPPLHTPV